MAQLQDEAKETIDPLLRLFHLLDCTDLQKEWMHRRDCLFHTPGYCVISSVLSDAECCDAIGRIWEFINDTTYGEVRQDDPITWSIIWPNTKVSKELDGVYERCFFRSNGAGFLLSDIHEILADRVFSSLFGTRELHSSKEGFLFCPSILKNDTPHNFHLSERDMLTHMTCTSGSISRRNHSNMPHVRAMIAFEDQCGIPSFVCYPNSIKKEGPRDVENGHNEEDVKGNLCDTTCFSMLNEVVRPDNIEKVSLRRGEVLIWRSDLIYSLVDPQPSTSAAMFCSMHPAILTPTAILPMKIEAYKQRQTGTYFADKEQWIISSSDSIQQNPYHYIRTRQFFRSSPPLVTMRQAQLYGLVPYSMEAELKNERRDCIHRALIRGVRFAERDERCFKPPLASARAESKVNGAHLIHLTTNDPADMIGQDKYLGGMASPCGKYIYGVPGSARQVLRIRIDDGHMDLIGPLFEGKFKWLRGVDVKASKMNHDPTYPDGCCLALPCNSASVLKINPSTNHVYSFGEDVLKDCGSDRWHYHGGTVASNGWLYAIPANADRVIKIHPVSDEVVFIGPSFVGGQKWFGGITGSDGCIYGIPHNEQNVLKIDPTNDTISLLVLENGKPLPAGQWKWHGGLRSGDKIYGFPNNAESVLVIHCRENRVYTIDGGGQLLKSGQHRIPQDNRYKYLGGATTLDQRYAYLFPCDAERVLRIDCLTDELCLVGPPLLDGENKFQNGFVGRDGCLYGIPQRASGVLQILPRSLASSCESSRLLHDSDDDHVDLMDCGPDLIGVKDKFEGGVLGPDGCIYCIPLRSKVCIKIVPGKR